MLSIRNRPYVTAARALGLTNRIILTRYVLPNAAGSLIVAVSAGLGTAMVLESAFSFLGIGVNPPTPSWGNMIREHYAYITTDLAYLAIVPGFMIMLLVLAFMMVGNGLRDALDVRE